MGDDLAAAMARLWTANRPKILARATTVLAALEDRAAGRSYDREAAAREAHTLAGALGTYGRPGSALFRRWSGSWPASRGLRARGRPASCAERVRRALLEI